MLATGRICKAPPHTTQLYSGPNHILVSRRSRIKSLRARARRLLDSGNWPEVHLHGLGAALGLTVTLAAEIVRDSGGRIVDSTSTSTEMLVDRGVDSESTKVRFNSAVHVKLVRTE